MQQDKKNADDDNDDEGDDCVASNSKPVLHPKKSSAIYRYFSMKFRSDKLPSPSDSQSSPAHAVVADDDEIDFEIFNRIKTKCKRFDSCDFLQRIVAALKYYEVNGKDKFIEFCHEYYSTQCLNDYNHLLDTHRSETAQIAAKYQLRCESMHSCERSKRHFRDRAEEKSNDENESCFVEIFDQIHFALCHLRESGYRLDDVEENENLNYLTTIDIRTSTMMREIRSKRLASQAIDHRLSDTTGNKYNIVVNDNENDEVDAPSEDEEEDEEKEPQISATTRT